MPRKIVPKLFFPGAWYSLECHARLSGIFEFKLVNKADNSEEEIDEEEINSEIQLLLDNKDSINT